MVYNNIKRVINGIAANTWAAHIKYPRLIACRKNNYYYPLIKPCRIFIKRCIYLRMMVLNVSLQFNRINCGWSDPSRLWSHIVSLVRIGGGFKGGGEDLDPSAKSALSKYILSKYHYFLQLLWNYTQ